MDGYLGVAEQGTPLIVAPQNQPRTSNQLFYMDNNGVIRNANSKMVLKNG